MSGEGGGPSVVIGDVILGPGERVTTGMQVVGMGSGLRLVLKLCTCRVPTNCLVIVAD